jgi:protein MpaA
MLTLLAAGCASSSPALRTPAASFSGSATIVGYTVQNRPIVMHNFGGGPRPVLILAAIHGDEPTSAAVAHALIELLQRYPQTPANVPIAIMPTANPDGYAAGTRTNARGVDLNRNFPAQNFSNRPRSRRSFGGSAPLSEPESRALLETINRLNPRLIISIHSMDKPCNNYDGPAQAIAELMSRHNGYPPADNIGYPTPGSLGSYAGIDRQIPMVTLELPRSARGEQAWGQNKDALLAAIRATGSNN